MSFACVSSSDKFGSNGFVVCCCGCGANGGLTLETSGFDAELVFGSFEPVFNHFHLLDLGGRCSGGLWLTDVIWDVWDSWDSIRSDIVSNLSLGLFPDWNGNCNSWRDDAEEDGFVTGGESICSALAGWIFVSGMIGNDDVCCVCDTLLVIDDEGADVDELVCEATRFSWDILRNFDINFLTGWSELIWSKPSFFLVSANSRSRLTSDILRNTT